MNALAHHNRKPDGPLTVAERNAMLEAWLAVHPRPVRLVARANPGLYRSLRAGGCSDDEVNGECLYAAVRSARRFDPTRGVPFPLFALRAMANYCRSLLRDQDRRTRRHAADNAGEPERGADQAVAVEDADALALVRRLVADLMPADRAVMEAVYGLDGNGGRVEAEVARDLGVTRTRVWQRKRRALRRLRTTLGLDAGSTTENP